MRLSLVRGSSVDNADVNIQLTQSDVQNDDKQRLVRLPEVFLWLSSSQATEKWPPILMVQNAILCLYITI